MPVSDATRTELRTALLAATADRPAHRRFAEHLLAVGDVTPMKEDARWDEMNEAAEDVPAGVSDSIADALTEDLLWILVISHNEHAPPFPGRYRALRLRGARAAATRREREQHRVPRVLADRLAFLSRD